MLPADESKRLASLHALHVLDSPPEREFEALVQTAALVCGTPISLISLIDTDRQWFKANVGLPGVTQTPREVAFCDHAIRQPALFEVTDATDDERFAANPLVTGDPQIRFYAGVPLRLLSGAQVGTLCVIDRRPRTLDSHQREILQHLATVATQALETRRLAKEHARAEANFKGLSESAPLGIFAADRDGACTYTNPTWQRIFGLSQQASLGDGWSQTLHPDDASKVFKAWNDAAATLQDFDMAFRVRRPDGAVRSVRAVSRPVLGDDGIVGHVGAVEDVTERQRIEQALQKSEELLRETGELAGVGGWELDIASQTITWSEQTCRIHGVPPGYQPRLDEAILFYAPEVRGQIEAAVALAMGSGKGWDIELPFMPRGGGRIWVRAVGHVERVNGKPVRLYGAFQDVTERVTQRLQIERAHERMSLANDSGGIAVWEFDVATRLLTWDAWMYRLYGLTPGNPQEAAPYDLWARHLHPEDRARAEQAVTDALTGSRAFDTEFRVVWANGNVRHLRACARVTRDALGQPIRMVGVNWDVTHNRQLAAQLSEQHELLRVTLQSIGDAVITTDADGAVTWLNPAAERMTGWSSAEAQGRKLQQVFHIINQDSRLPTENPVAACLRLGKIVGLANHTVLISRDGEEFGIEDSAAPIRAEDGHVLGAVLVFHDVTEQRRLSGEMSYRASHDALTGLVNRPEFESRLRRVLNRANEDHSEHALLYIDLDQFKLVNDACGHSVGDQLLQQVSKLFAEVVRSRDTLARLGGDEFGAILEHCTGEQGMRVALQICERMEDFRFLHEGRRFRIGASIGLVPLDKRWPTLAALMQAADTSCYAAKDAGRNRVHAWYDTDTTMRERHGEMQWATRLEQALDEGRFVLYAQRIDSLRDSRPHHHAEVLLRMVESDGTLVLPGAFLPAAERFHLCSRIDRWVLRHAIASIVPGSTMNGIETLCINLSGQSIGDRAFHRHAIDLLQQVGGAVCRRICLEITETAAVTNLADAALFIEQVRGLGVQVALDDFGAGASSFGYLKKLAVDVLKIDGQFIKGLRNDPLSEAAVRCFVDVALVVGVKTVAEFVDCEKTLERVKQLGIDYAQGFLLHCPEPIERLLGIGQPALALSAGASAQGQVRT